LKKPSQKMAGRMAQSVGPEFKPHYCKKKEITLKILFFCGVGRWEEQYWGLNLRPHAC
jgi:hypothetical protein